MTDKKTITSIFMVPTLNIPKGELKENGFINGFVRDENREVQYANSIYLLFKPRDLNKFRLFLESEYERTKSIIEDYNYDDGFVVVVYQLDEIHNKDFDLVRQGKYSKTSRAFQALFPRVVKIIKNGLHRDEISLQYRIFNKTPDMIEFWEEKFDVTFTEDLEVWRGFCEENEILTKEKLDSYVK